MRPTHVNFLFLFISNNNNKLTNAIAFTQLHFCFSPNFFLVLPTPHSIFVFSFSSPPPSTALAPLRFVAQFSFLPCYFVINLVSLLTFNFLERFIINIHAPSNPVFFSFLPCKNTTKQNKTEQKLLFFCYFTKIIRLSFLLMLRMGKRKEGEK
uniref:Uncharacterized protein n=1 Tax=Trypanosoma vivax (strain Y486) TaxID=1055687 RepID=G0TZT4_TRYVY|nr:hypothetical protein TVY486_0807190 [Trypanosoma vivax Y486]